MNHYWEFIVDHLHGHNVRIEENRATYAGDGYDIQLSLRCKKDYRIFVDYVCEDVRLDLQYNIWSPESPEGTYMVSQVVATFFRYMQNKESLFLHILRRTGGRIVLRSFLQNQPQDKFIELICRMEMKYSTEWVWTSFLDYEVLFVMASDRGFWEKANTAIQKVRRNLRAVKQLL